MKKEKVDPKRPPVKDLQGHTYQPEVGDPDVARNIDRKLIRWRKDIRDRGVHTVGNLSCDVSTAAAERGRIESYE
jgi:hypothetical protein